MLVLHFLSLLVVFPSMIRNHNWSKLFLRRWWPMIQITEPPSSPENLTLASVTSRTARIAWSVKSSHIIIFLFTISQNIPHHHFPSRHSYCSHLTDARAVSRAEPKIERFVVQWKVGWNNQVKANTFLRLQSYISMQCYKSHSWTLTQYHSPSAIVWHIGH